MVGEAIAGLGAVKTAFDMAKALQSIHDTVARDRAVMDLQKEILTAQQAQATLIKEVGDLEAEVARLKNWEADKQRYQLAELAPGVVAFAIKEAMRNGEPFHYICANCCAKGAKSYLQQHIRGPNFDQFKCNACGEELGIDKKGPRESYSTPYSGGSGPSSWMGS